MPTYEYECEACGNRWEVFQKITAKPVKLCVRCKKMKARRILSSGAGILFKGSGFHTTDYRSPSYKKALAAETETGKSKPKESTGTSVPAKKTTEK